MVEEKETSQRFKWVDFRLSKNIKSALKNSAYIMIPAILTELVANNVIAAGLAGVIGSAICKAIEYWASA
jgi:hypothetical protein